MANPALKRGEALVWLPARHDAEPVLQRGEAGLMAWRAAEGALPPRVDRVSLEGLQGTSLVSLLFDPRDVTLLTPVVPPLSGARLHQALPHVVEDALLQDVSGCAVLAGPVLAEGRRLVAVMDRGWLETAVQAFEGRGMRVRAAWPAQLALPLQSGRWSLVCLRDVLALRTGPEAGYGWAAGWDAAARQAALVAALELALSGGVRPEAVSVWIDDAAWSEPLRAAMQALDLSAEIASLAPLYRAHSALNLLAGRASKGRRWLATWDPQAWRWPAGLALACVGVSLLGLNAHWAQLSREKAALRAALEAGFRGAFPQAQVVVDPMLQMTRQLAELRARAGQRSPDDVLPLMARLAEALGETGVAAVRAVEYRDGTLTVRFEAAVVERPSQRERLQRECERLGLTLQFDSEREPTARVGLRV